MNDGAPHVLCKLPGSSSVLHLCFSWFGIVVCQFDIIQDGVKLQRNAYLERYVAISLISSWNETTSHPAHDSHVPVRGSREYFCTRDLSWEPPVSLRSRDLFQSRTACCKVLNNVHYPEICNMTPISCTLLMWHVLK